MIDLLLIAAVVGGCLVGGFVKGVTGSGLPQVAVPVISLLTDVPTAVAIVQFPALAINLAQLRPRGHPAGEILKHWPIVMVLFVTTIFGVGLLRVAPPSALFAFMGLITIATTLLLRLNPDYALSPRLRLPVGIPLAGAAGLSAGLSSLAGPFLIPYFLSLRLPKDLFVAAISLCYLSIIIPIVTFFLVWNVVDPRLFLFSLAAVVPSLAGMWLGNVMRDRFQDAQFRRAVLLMLLASAASLLVKSFVV